MSKPTSRAFRAATPAMTDPTILPFSFPAVARKKVTADFDGGRNIHLYDENFAHGLLSIHRLFLPTLWPG